MTVVYENDRFYVKQWSPKLFSVRKVGDHWAIDFYICKTLDEAKEKTNELCEMERQRSERVVLATVGDGRIELRGRRSKSPSSKTRARTSPAQGR